LEEFFPLASQIVQTAKQCTLLHWRSQHKSIMMNNSCERFEFKHKIIAYSLLDCQALQPELKIANPHPAWKLTLWTEGCQDSAYASQPLLQLSSV
jgi:hypothetical protein